MLVGPPDTSPHLAFLDGQVIQVEKQQAPELHPTLERSDPTASPLAAGLSPPCSTHACAR